MDDPKGSKQMPSVAMPPPRQPKSDHAIAIASSVTRKSKRNCLTKRLIAAFTSDFNNNNNNNDNYHNNKGFIHDIEYIL
jgi:hypothetical protein